MILQVVLVKFASVVTNRPAPITRIIDAATCAIISTRAAPPIRCDRASPAQHIVHAARDGAARRQQADQHAGGQRRPPLPRAAPADPAWCSSSGTARADADHRRQHGARPPRQRHGDHQRGQREQHAVDQHLLDQPAAADPHGDPHRELVLPRQRPRQHQAAQVDAADHQQRRRRAPSPASASRRNDRARRKSRARTSRR